MAITAARVSPWRIKFVCDLSRMVSIADFQSNAGHHMSWSLGVVVTKLLQQVFDRRHHLATRRFQSRKTDFHPR